MSEQTKCKNCSGTGKESWGDQWTDCGWCDGTGKIAMINAETAPLLERIAELEAALADATLFGDVNSGEVDFTRLHGQELERYFEARKRHLARKGQQK